MIQITKPVSPPSSLLIKGIAETKKNCSLYDADPAAYNSSRSKFVIHGKIYNAATIKTALKRAQHGKCCFCEKKQVDEYGAVEHYRPKSGYKAKRKDKLKKPGYYWLGYLWDNLFFVCGPCNIKKGNIFPLKDETKRAINHNGKVALEKPLLLNPSGLKDPRNHIKFTNEFIRGYSIEGKETVDICKLDREGLNEERRKHLNEIEDRILTIIANLDFNAVSRAKRYLKNCVKKDAKFSAMAIDYLKQQNIIIT